jgi:phosphoglucosamine mutase
MKRNYFGTDGIRGPVSGPLFEAGFLNRLGRALGQWLMTRGLASRRVVIGRDTRESGERILIDLAAGFQSEGYEVVDLGVIPTPGVAVSVPLMQAALGIVISASHNPFTDNGIKLFDESGCKLSDETEVMIESVLERIASQVVKDTEPPSVISGVESYIDFFNPWMGLLNLSGKRIVVDCANGATCVSTPAVLERLGADVYVIGNNPDGRNINLGCGSEHPELLQRAVVEQSADWGLAHDGDGDRLVFCTREGRIVDGDHLLAWIACQRLLHGSLAGNTLVATHQSNLALDRTVEAFNGRVVRVPVGDRYVLHAMQKSALNTGGESSGHIILRDYSTTGDGLTAALEILKRCAHSTIGDLCLFCRTYPLFPQLTLNVVVSRKVPLESFPELQDEIRALESRLKGQGRILVRYSGTESKLRLLVEAPSDTLAKSTLIDLKDALGRYLTFQ